MKTTGLPVACAASGVATPSEETITACIARPCGDVPKANIVTLSLAASRRSKYAIVSA